MTGSNAHTRFPATPRLPGSADSVCAGLAGRARRWRSLGAALAEVLPVPRLGDEEGGTGGVVAGLLDRVEGRGFTGDGQVQVDTVQQWAGEFVAVALDLFGRAATPTAGFAEVAAGAGVHRRDQLKARRETHPITSAGDDDVAGLQGWYNTHIFCTSSQLHAQRLRLCPLFLDGAITG